MPTKQDAGPEWQESTKIGREMQKAAESKLHPQPRKGKPVGGLNNTMLLCGRTMEEHVIYWDAFREGGVAGVTKEFSLFVI